MAAVSPPPNSTASPVPPALFPPSSPPLVSSLPSSPPQASLPPSTPPPASPPPPSISPASPPPASPPASPPPSTLPPASPPPPTPPPASPPPPFISPASPPPASPPASPPPSTPPPASPPPSTPPPASPPPARASPPASPPQSTPPVFPPPSSISPASPPPASPPASPPPSTPPLASPAPSTPPSASSSPPPPATPASPPPSSPGVASPPPSTPASPPPLNEASPASSPPAPPPQSPPTNVTSPPLANSPPSSSTAPPPEPANTPPPASSPSPPGTPTSAPPPPSPVPPSSSPAPPSTNPPVSSSPPPSVNSPSSSPPPPLSSHENAPPKSPPPSPSPSPVTNPPRHPPPPASGPPNKSPPPPASPPTKLPTPPSSPSVVSPPSNFPPTFPPPPPISLSSPSPSTSPSLPSLPLPSSDANNNINTASNSSSSNGGRGIGTGGIIAIGLIFGFVLIGCVGLAVWCICKQKKRGSGPNNGYVLPTSVGSSAQPDSALVKLGSSANDIGTSSGKKFVDSPTDPGGLGNSRSWFTYEELVQATDGFAAQNFLGEGGFGSVYKGTLADGRVVAVKQLKIGGGQGEREFKAEIEIISRINHRNLVSLVGYCVSESRRMLVYDYVPNNTLYFHLHGEGRPVMDWAMRVKVAVGAARGIAYLHEDCIPRIVHRDIKSSNILLDDNFEARVSDFGLAKLFQLVNTHVTTRVMGTFGYMAPEYAASGKLTEKSDVFSFGVVLLELITGRKPVDASQPLGDESLVEWARPLLSHALESQEFEQLVDPRLERNYVDAEMFRLIEVAAACVRHSSAKRPQMGQVVRAFDTMSTWDITNGMRVGESEIFNSAQQSEEIRLFQRMAFGNQAYSADFFTGSSFISRLETFKASQLDAQNTI